MGQRLSTGAVDILAANFSYVAWAPSTGKRAIIRKIMWYNNTGAAGYLRIGYLTLGAVFTQVLPNILMVNLADGELGEAEIPITGNTREGFYPDTTAGTGTLGNIIVQGTVGGAAPTCRVTMEIEEE